MTFPDEERPNIFFLLSESPSKGKYPNIFDYRYRKHTHENITWNIWGLLFWDRILITLLFHDVKCRCQGCILKKGEKS